MRAYCSYRRWMFLDDEIGRTTKHCKKYRNRRKDRRLLNKKRRAYDKGILMKSIVCLLILACPCYGEVWKITQTSSAKSVWAITQKPSKVSKVCACSKECTCGCNQGKECDCGKPKPQSPYRIVTQPESWSCTVGNG